MAQIQKILIPTDFSKAAENATKYALNFTEDDESIQITIVHVCEDAPSQDEKEQLEARYEDLKNKYQGADAQINYEVRTGELIPTILQSQSDLGIDLTVMGTKGSDSEDDPTNTSELVLAADCPILVIPEDTEEFRLKNIALALGRNEIDDSFALGVLHSIARKFGAAVHILTINNEGEGIQIGDNNESILEYYLETLDFQHAFPANSDIEMGIAGYVKEKQIDMLAILPRNHAKKSKPSEGRLTKLLTLRSEVPLLSID